MQSGQRYRSLAVPGQTISGCSQVHPTLQGHLPFRANQPNSWTRSTQLDEVCGRPLRLQILHCWLDSSWTRWRLGEDTKKKLQPQRMWWNGLRTSPRPWQRCLCMESSWVEHFAPSSLRTTPSASSSLGCKVENSFQCKSTRTPTTCAWRRSPTTLAKRYASFTSTTTFLVEKHTSSRSPRTNHQDINLFQCNHSNLIPCHNQM